ncbi:MAG: ABC transporter substrate-binding protein [Pseudorhodoplanes sp.]
MAHAVNAAAIAKNLVSEKSEIVHSVCHPRQFGCYTDVPFYKFDPAKARSLLAEAGYPNGFSTEIFSFRERPWTEAVINDLSKVGIKASLRYMQYAATRQALRSGEAKIADQPWGSFGIPDASAFTSYFFSGGPDDINRDPEIIAWLQKADSSMDPEVRKENYKKALIRIAEQSYWVPLFTYTLVYGLNKDLDFKPDFDETPRFFRAKWK